MPLPELATVREVADALHCTTRFVREELIAKKKVRAVQLADRGNWRIDVESVEQLVGRKVRRRDDDDYDEAEAIASAVRMGWLD